MNNKYFVKKSQIHGNGIFASTTILKNEIIDNVIKYKYYFIPYISSKLGSTVNHCTINYNTKLQYNYKKQLYDLVAINQINKNDEILLNYWDTPFYIEKPSKNYKKC